MRWTTVVVIVVIVVVVVLAAFIFLLWKCWRRIKGKGTDHISDKLSLGRFTLCSLCLTRLFILCRETWHWWPGSEKSTLTAASCQGIETGFLRAGKTT
jgi:hypothetical protein